MQAQHKASEALYKNQQDASAGASGASGAEGSGNTQSSGAKPEGDVIDAEVVEDEKK